MITGISFAKPRSQAPPSDGKLGGAWERGHVNAVRAHAQHRVVSWPARARLPARNGLVNEVEFLGLIPQNGERPMRLRDR